MGKVHRDIRGEVVGRVVNFVKQLLFYRLLSDTAAGIGRLGDDQAAILLYFDNRVAHRGEARHVFKTWVGKIAAAYLGTTLGQVPGHHAASQAIPIVPTPVEVVHQRR